MTARPIVSGTTPTFAVWISNRDDGGGPSGNPHIGETGIASANVKVYAAAPGANLPGSPISNTHYTWTERGRGHYDLAFSQASYFTGAGISRVSVAFDDGIYSYPLVEIFYLVGAHPVDVRTWLGSAVATPTVAGVPRVEVASAMTDSISAASVAAATVTKIVDGFMTRAHDTGVTLGGLWKRLESWITGAKSESGPVDARVYDWKDRDGNTAFTGTVDTTTGARGQSDVSGSEPP